MIKRALLPYAKDHLIYAISNGALTMTGKSIFAPTDFSRDAAEALHYASILARTLDKPMTLVHVKPSSVLRRSEEDVDDPQEAIEPYKQYWTVRRKIPDVA